MTVPEGTTIRQARREDVPTILQLIRELAIYEKEESSVLATELSLSNTIAFAASPIISAHDTTPSPDGDIPSPSRPARCLLIFNAEGEAAGMALYFYNYSTWRARPGIYLEDLFVRENMRKNGYGLRLVAELAKEVIEMDGGRLEWSVLKWNEPSIRFYEDVVGATAMSGWVGMRVDGKNLEKLAERAA
ncbi:acetyltransferase-like protein [Tricladium varicosporioides]|nr:acetyltransferase-like protein [Hymenoscyphus varicosporioides]